MIPGSIRIARIAGIDVYIHVTFLLLLAYVGFVGWGIAGQQGMIFFTVVVLLLFLCVLLHEFGHALAARRYGIKTPDITLLPIGGVARIEQMPEKPAHEVVVALAGPAVNVVIAGGIGIALWLTDSFQINAFFNVLFSRPSLLVSQPGAILHWLFINNLLLAVFNMIPAFPMDGGRVLRALLAMHLPLTQATRVAAKIGQTLAIFLGVLGLFIKSPLLILLAVFVFIGAQQETRSAEVRAITRDLKIRDVLITQYKALSRAATLHDAVDALLSSYQLEFPVVDSDGSLLGLLTRREMVGASRTTGMSTPVLQIMRKDVAPIEVTASFDEAMRRLEECNCPALPVVDELNRVIGLFTPENVSEMVMIREAMEEARTQSPRAAL